MHFFHISGSHSWEGEVHKTSKQQHIFEAQKSSAAPFHHQNNQQPYRNLWPPFSVSLTTIQNTHTTAQANNFATSSIFPTFLYIPQQIQQQDHQYRQMQAMPGVFYQSVVYPHPSTFYPMQFQPAPNQLPVNNSMYNSAFQFEKGTLPMRSNIQTPENQNTFQRPPSQATSVKADMGSTSASLVNRVSF